MKDYTPYIGQLQDLVNRLIKPNTLGADAHAPAVLAALDGQPGKELRNCVSLDQLRLAGAYFTGRQLSERLAAPLAQPLQGGATVSDPACGAGDLLVACARHLPVFQNLMATLETWGTQLHGQDIHPEFVLATKLRLMLLALSRGSVPLSAMPSPDDVFPFIRVADSLERDLPLSPTEIFVLNPPFTLVALDERRPWADGVVSEAALFIERLVLESSKGTQIHAILPDVLRAGSRYRRWREFVAERAEVDQIRLAGHFDALTEVNVFTCRLTVDTSPMKMSAEWWSTSETRDEIQQRLSDLVEVKVGTVVPHRHPDAGEGHPFAQVHDLPAWQIVQCGDLPRRGFSGTVFKPPFVAVRRTSRSDDSYRAVGTLVTGSEAVAVENHLLVLIPNDSSLSKCRAVLRNLRDDRTKRWLDERIRCRHMTVTALRDLPWWESVHGS